jgi:hypothetical protein
MQEVILTYNSDAKEIVVMYKNNLLEGNVDLLKKYLDMVKSLPDDYSVEEYTANKVMIHIPYEIPDGDGLKLEGKFRATGKTADMMQQVQIVLARFSNAALRKEMKELEIIPLSGYPFTEIQKDVKSAIDAGRGFCIVDSMKNYESFAQGEKFSMCQAIYPYMSDTYCNIAIAVNEGPDMSGVRGLVEGNLQEYDWM